MFNWIKLIKFIKKHRNNGIASFRVTTNSDTFIITTEDCKNTVESRKENMLRLKYK
jgi:hypothetical protein